MATVTVYGDGTDFLPVPGFVTGGVTGVTVTDGSTVPAFVEREGLLVTVDSTGHTRARDPLPWYGTDVPTPLVWQRGTPYTVTYTPATTVAPTTDEIASLRLLIADADGVLFEDSAVTAALQTNATGDGYDLNGAAADLWRVRAASLAGASAATASVQSESYNGHSTTYAVTGSDSPLAYALKMATYYDGLRVAGATRSGWVF